MNLFVELSEKEKDRCVVASYYIETNSHQGTLRDAVWDIAIGQSIGNPNVRSVWETEEMYQRSSCVIYADEAELDQLTSGVVQIGFPKINIDWETDGISQLLCYLMGGHLDINVFKTCRLIDIQFPTSVEKCFFGPKYGIDGIREFVHQYDKPILGAIIKPKTGFSVNVLGDVVKELLDGGVDFIKEDEMLSNPSFCRLEDRVEYISNIIDKSGRNVIYSFCINGDPHVVLDRCKFVSNNGGNGVHVNIWSGLGIYNSIRKLDLPLFLHFHKSGDKILTDNRHNFGINWNVISDLAGMMGVDTIHAGMYGGYISDTLENVEHILYKTHKRNVLPSLSGGLHPGNVNKLRELFGNDFLANSGGGIHGHPNGTMCGANALRQAIDKAHGKEYYQAIEKWGLTV